MALTDDVKELTVGHARMTEKLDSMNHKLDCVVRAVSGDGEKRLGLVVRVDRLERTTKLSGKLIWLIVTGVIAALTSVAVAAVTGG